MENKIVLINVKDIYPHPDNPRKSVGDLTELIASVKENGILQNLTVVPCHDEVLGDIYTVLIGHRRLAAAESAGLETVPCAILEGLTREEEIGIMITENIQRADLTILEEAEALQMMMDLGMPAKAVADKTGLSESTVRRRSKLLSLNREKVEKGIEQGATLFEFEQVFQIEDEKKREELTALAGTKDFEWKLSSAIEKEKNVKIKEQIKEVLDSFAEKVKKVPEGYTYYEWLGSDAKGLKRVKEIKEKNLDLVYKDEGYFSLYIKKEEVKLLPEEEKARAEQSEKCKKMEMFRNKVKEIGEKAYEKRLGFIKSFKASRVSLEDIIGFAVYAILCGNYVDPDDAKELTGLKVDYEELSDVIKEIAQSSKSLEILVKAAYLSFNDFADEPYSYNCGYDGDSSLIPLYKALEGIGYELATEEEDWLMGRIKAEE